MSTADIFFSNVPKVKEQPDILEETEDSLEDTKNLCHTSYTTIDDFMSKFFELPIFK